MSFITICAKFFSFFFIILLLLCSLFCIMNGLLGCRLVDIVDGVGPSIGLTVIGAVNLLICILGFVGLRRQSPRLMWVFVGLSITMWVVSVGLYVGNSNSDLEADVKKVVDDTWKKEIVQEGSMDRIQKLYQCCGRDSFDDYTFIGRLPPKTCCFNLTCDHIWPQGCQTNARMGSIRKYLRRKLSEIITGSALFLCILIAPCMAILFKKQKGRPNY